MQEYEEFIPTISARAKKKVALLKTLASMEVMEIEKRRFLEDTDFTTADLKFAVERNWITIVQKEVNRDPYKGRVFKKSAPFQLNPEQQVAFDRVKAESIDTDTSKVYLLEGVTGSGKRKYTYNGLGKSLKRKECDDARSRNRIDSSNGRPI